MSAEDMEDAMSEVVPLDSPSRRLIDDRVMTPPREAHLERIVSKHAAGMRAKYLEGQRANGGDLFAKPGMLAHALAENVDQTCYLRSLEEQIEHLARELRAGGITQEQAAAALERMVRT
jgi:hypothetical protein